MSSALYSAVPNTLTGPNYLEWAQSMQSYLMAQGQWNVIVESRPAATATDELKAFSENNISRSSKCLLPLWRLWCLLGSQKNHPYEMQIPSICLQILYDHSARHSESTYEFSWGTAMSEGSYSQSAAQKGEAARWHCHPH